MDTEPVKLKHWMPATDARSPWAPRPVMDAITQWLREAEFADELAAAGEKTMPLLLAGESRCGKTSTLCRIARGFGLPAYRMNVASMIGSCLGDTTKAVVRALEETVDSTAAVWILDEADGIFGKRGEDRGGGAARELNTAMTSALTVIENLPAHVTLAGTTNAIGLIDPAMLARFTVVEFPKWSVLTEDERKAFARSHGCEPASGEDSYAAAVQGARADRVRKIIEKAKRQKGAA